MTENPQLRAAAEGRLERAPEDLADLTPDEIRRMLHELRVHQVELEMQNEELRRTQVELGSARARYFNLYDLAPVGYITLGETGQILETNFAAAKLLGVTRGELSEHWLHRFIAKQDHDSYYQFKQQIMASGDPQACELRMVKADGTTVWARLDATATQDNDGKRAVHITLTDISEQKRQQDVQRFLARTSSSTVAEPFFNALARYLAHSLDMDFVCIDILEGDGLNARTLAVWCDGQFEDNVTYALKDTPCGDVVGQTLCCFPASVCKYFPRDQVLKDLRAESYLGTTLWSRDGKPIGLIAVIGRNPLVQRAQAEATLKLVAERTANELERVQADAVLAEAKALLLKEVQHRVHDNLQLLASLLRLQAHQSSEPQTLAALTALQTRLGSVALLHETLSHSGNYTRVELAGYLGKVATRLFRAQTADSGAVTLLLDLAPVEVATDLAVPCGLLMNELVTNALKHGFPGEAFGEVRIGLRQTADGQLHLRVADDGVGLPPGLDLQNLTSLGLKLASDLARQLGGRLEIGAGPGAVFEIEFKASKS